jgi:hypothetical protein
MSIWRLVVREIAHRKMNFVLSLLSVSIAVGTFVGALRLLEWYEMRTTEILTAQQAEVKATIDQQKIKVGQAGAQLNDAMRRITKGLGFNIFILPATQDLESFHLRGELTETMPESHVKRLSESKLMTINHLLPIVTRRLPWRGPRQEQTLNLIGTRGEVPILHRNPNHPLQDPVEPGNVVVGYHIHTKQGLQRGDKITLLGQEFQVSDLHPKRNSIDDSTVWISLRTAQQLLGLENLIHAIMALECNCAAQDRVGQIRAEIAGLLPGTKVEELSSQALARAEARTQAKQAAEAALARQIESGNQRLQHEKTGQAKLAKQRELLAAVLVPLTLVGAALWIGMLALANVRQRNMEIGILRAIGFRSRQIVGLVLAKALLVGLLGACLGYGLGLVVANLWGEASMTGDLAARWISPGLMMTTLGIATLLSGLASWIPALLAAGQDPADVLREG